ncbi:MAG TPA: Smr/MutS family protein [Pyrinomonadaceae bacterium]|nr:Smr/MutS family protein [Pyrinomonadaceae bacterium]
MRLIGWLSRIFPSRHASARSSRASARQSDDAPDDFTDDDADVDPFDPFPEPVRIEIRDIIDLHTIARRDVGRVVEEYLREARHAGFRSVRIIHGKGIGVQREAVRRILARTPFVQNWTDAPAEAGGWGATIVRFSHVEPDSNPSK